MLFWISRYLPNTHTHKNEELLFNEMGELANFKKEKGTTSRNTVRRRDLEIQVWVVSCDLQSIRRRWKRYYEN